MVSSLECFSSAQFGFLPARPKINIKYNIEQQNIFTSIISLDQS